MAHLAGRRSPAPADHTEGMDPDAGRWLLCDYGEVLCTAPRPEDRAQLERLAACEPQVFWQRYWEHRPAYDRGDIDVAQYWTASLGHRPEPPLLAELLEADIAGWLHPNRDVLAAAARAAAAGLRLAVLSNAPVEHAAVYDRLEWLAAFSPRLFSCHFRMVKPEPAIFEAALRRLGAEPAEVIFLDDRPANVGAARAVGIEAELFEDAAQVDRLTAEAVARGGSRPRGG
jgi:putative hydrolase of the HAD superfamily